VLKIGEVPLQDGKLAIEQFADKSESYDLRNFTFAPGEWEYEMFAYRNLTGALTARDLITVTDVFLAADELAYNYRVNAAAPPRGNLPPRPVVVPQVEAMPPPPPTHEPRVAVALLVVQYGMDPTIYSSDEDDSDNEAEPEPTLAVAHQVDMLIETNTRATAAKPRGIVGAQKRPLPAANAPTPSAKRAATNKRAKKVAATGITGALPQFD